MRTLVLLVFAFTAAMCRGDEERDWFPLLTEAGNKKKLRCSVCAALSDEVYKGLSRISRQRRPREYEVVAILEDSCPKLVKEYELVNKDGMITTTFSKNKALQRSGGSAVTGMFLELCGEILSDHDDLLSRRFDAKQTLMEFQQELCVKADNTCTNGDLEVLL